MGLVTAHRGAAVPAQRGSDDFSAAWAAALDDLELEVDRAERLLRAEHTRTDADNAPAAGAWAPPTLRTPLPDSMRERAERLLERQLAVAGRLSTAMTSSRRHLEVVDRLVPSDARPMYLDEAL